MKQVMNLSGDMVNKKPEPGSIWTAEKDHLRWLYIAQDGNHAVKITIRKETGKVIDIDLEGYIDRGDCREISIAEN
jgi:hypothetical protein